MRTKIQLKILRNKFQKLKNRKVKNKKMHFLLQTLRKNGIFERKITLLKRTFFRNKLN